MKTLKEVAELLKYNDWQEIKDYHRDTSGLAIAETNETKLFEKNLSRSKTGNILSYKNLVFATRIETSDGQTIKAPISCASSISNNTSGAQRKGKFSLSVNSIIFSPAGSKAFFTCTDCQKEFMVECNFAKWSRYFDCLCCKSCKKKTVSKTKSHVDRYEKSMLTKYGCKRPLQNAQIMKKFTTKMRETYGVEYSAQSKELYLKTLINTSWKNRTSKKERDFAQAVMSVCPNVLTCLSDKKPYIKLKNTYKYPDIMFQNRIIEFFGNYWHANPNLYNSHSIMPSGKFALDVWEKDKERINLLKSMGYHVMIVWEQDWDFKKETILEEVREFINGN